MAYFFLVLNNIPLSGCTSLFTHSSTEGHLGGFQVLAIMNKAAMKHLCPGFLCGHNFSTPLCKYQGVRLLDRIVRVCLVL